MQQELFSESDIQPIISSYLPDIISVVRQSYDFYTSLMPNLGNQQIRTRCDIIRSKAIQLFDQKYLNSKEVKIIRDDDDTFALILLDKIILRFKKLSRNHRANFNKNPRSKYFINQKNINGFLTSKLNLILGYLPDPTWSKLNGIFVSHPQGKYAINLEELLEETKKVSEQISKPIEILNDIDQKDLPVRIKNNKESFKNGTGSNKS